MPEIRIVPVDNPGDLAQALAIREVVFIEEQRVQDQRKPIILDDGRIAVSTIDFQAYLMKTTCQKVSRREAASINFLNCGRSLSLLLPLTTSVNAWTTAQVCRFENSRNCAP